MEMANVVSDGRTVSSFSSLVACGGGTGDLCGSSHCCCSSVVRKASVGCCSEGTGGRSVMQDVRPSVDAVPARSSGVVVTAASMHAMCQKDVISRIVSGSSSMTKVSWWWQEPREVYAPNVGVCDRSRVGDACVEELTLAQAKREMLRVYAEYDVARAAHMMTMAEVSCLSHLELRDGTFIVPVDEDWDEAVRREIPLVVILRFALWVYISRAKQPLCGPPGLHDPAARAYSLLRQQLHGGACPPRVCGHVDADGAEVCGAPGVVTSVKEPVDEALHFLLEPLPDAALGACVDRADWLEVLAVFVPPACAAVLLARAEAACGGKRGFATFLSWRRGGVATGPDAALVHGSGTNSACRGAADIRSAFRVPTALTQTFLFHGEFHVLHHLEGVVRSVAGAGMPACVVGDTASDKGGEDNTNVDVFVVEDNRDADVDAIVDYAEALLLPAFPARPEVTTTTATTTTTVCSTGAEHGSREAAALRSASPLTGAAASSIPSALPDTLVAVCSGAFCLPRSTAARSDGVLSRWGFDSPTDPQPGCKCGLENAGDDADAYAAVSRHLPPAIFTKQLCRDVLLQHQHQHHQNCHNQKSTTVSVHDWWSPADCSSSSSSSSINNNSCGSKRRNGIFVTNDDDDNDDDDDDDDDDIEMQRIAGPLLRLFA